MAKYLIRDITSFLLKIREYDEKDKASEFLYRFEKGGLDIDDPVDEKRIDNHLKASKNPMTRKIRKVDFSAAEEIVHQHQEAQAMKGGITGDFGNSGVPNVDMSKVDDLSKLAAKGTAESPAPTAKTSATSAKAK